jgi:prepilin-type N-terminal cleavage/methylation domain-containing protein
VRIQAFRWEADEVLVGNERGFTLVELLLVMSMVVVVVGAAMTTLSSAERQTAHDVERAQVIREVQTGLYRMTRELRQAYRVTLRTNDELEVEYRKGGVNRAVRYSCTQPHPTRQNAYQCLRWENGTSRVVIDRVLNGPNVPAAQRVFQYPGKASYVRAQVRVPSSGQRRTGHRHNVVLDDGFYMRNCDVGC